MKTSYTTPSIDLISVSPADIIEVSIGDIEIEVGKDFF